jgi:hypothetical protein
MPLCIAKEALEVIHDWHKQNDLPGEYKPDGGHTLLAVVQEEGKSDNGQTRYIIHLFDSHNILLNAHPKLIEMAAAAEGQLQWGIHRDSASGQYWSRTETVL